MEKRNPAQVIEINKQNFRNTLDKIKKLFVFQISDMGIVLQFVA